MTMKYNRAKKPATSTEFYNKFDSINGEHPYMAAVKDGYIPYRVRQLDHGQVAYFNFSLAKEMGLISSNHPSEMNEVLQKKLLDTFALQIINEYDELSKRRIDPSLILPNKYMATRYLQLQHANKQGKTSGDGRGIWNGIIKHNNLTWDISSRGTGVTCLSPGSVEAKKALKTGGTEFGYGCGLAEMDELLGASILAEILHLQGLRTERVLCVIDLGKGYGIGVRAAPNLLRPAHLFLYLKQEKYDSLKAATDYLIHRQLENKNFNLDSKHPQKSTYDQWLSFICDSFAEFSAQLDTDYIFAWLDWDGDNVLADAGIIDYGSIRQFGIRHDKYRYDDVQRFSTNLNEQKAKARLMVKVFVQLVDYLKTKKKKPLGNFDHHPIVVKFNNLFKVHREKRILFRMGFDENQTKTILNQKSIFSKFEKEFTFLEKIKISGNSEKVADGVNHPPLFNVRRALKTYPRFIAESTLPLEERLIPEKTFFKIILSGFAKACDSRIDSKQARKILSFQKLYLQLIKISTKQGNQSQVIREICERSEKLNSEKRITGNALIEIVDEIIFQKNKGLSYDDIQSLIDQLIFKNEGAWDLLKENSDNILQFKRPCSKIKTSLLDKIIKLIDEHKESI
jgi:uncharacterized protein YdiU (UPF0061 family)